MFFGTIMYAFTDSEDYSFGKWVGFCWFGMFPWVFCFALWTLVSPTLTAILVVVVFVFALIVDGGRRTKEIRAGKSCTICKKNQRLVSPNPDIYLPPICHLKACREAHAAAEGEQIELQKAAVEANRDRFKTESINNAVEENNVIQVTVHEKTTKTQDRNSPCLCGSGKRFKHCHGALNQRDGRHYVPKQKNDNQVKHSRLSGNQFNGSRQGDEKCWFGSLTSPEGTHYVGEYKNGKKCGRGPMTAADGQSYNGNWKDSLKHGNGTLTLPNGTEYVGTFKDDKKHGHGILTSPDGRQYIGDWEDDKKHGHGTMTYSDGNQYVGDWKEDKKRGHGKMNYFDGNQYVGDWKDSVRHGLGAEILPDGVKVFGEWKEGKRHV